MQLASSKKVFDYMADLFCNKWVSSDEIFVEYFKYTPSTNNALESHNAVIKRKVTFRKRLPLNKFLITMTEMTEEISEQIYDEKRIIAEEPIISKETWSKAARMHINNFKSFKAKGSDEKKLYVIPSSKCEPNDANEKYYKSLVKREWESFDEFINFGFQILWVVSLSMTIWNVMSSCTCPFFFKQHMCKHIIAIAVKEKLIEFPEIANPVKLTKKRKPGRIPNAKKARG